MLLSSLLVADIVEDFSSSSENPFFSQYLLPFMQQPVSWVSQPSPAVGEGRFLIGLGQTSHLFLYARSCLGTGSDPVLANEH